MTVVATRTRPRKKQVFENEVSVLAHLEAMARVMAMCVLQHAGDAQVLVLADLACKQILVAKAYETSVEFRSSQSVNIRLRHALHMRFAATSEAGAGTFSSDSGFSVGAGSNALFRDHERRGAMVSVVLFTTTPFWTSRFSSQ